MEYPQPHPKIWRSLHKPPGLTPMPYSYPTRTVGTNRARVSPRGRPTS